MLWVSQLESKQQTNYFKTVLTLVDVVSKEQIIISMNISSISWCLPDVEESHQVNILTVDVTDNLDRWSDFFNNNWLSSEDMCTLICKFDNVLLLVWELSTRFDVLSIFWLQERFQEHLAKGVVRVFVNFSVILLLRI